MSKHEKPRIWKKLPLKYYGGALLALILPAAVLTAVLFHPSPTDSAAQGYSSLSTATLYAPRIHRALSVPARVVKSTLPVKTAEPTKLPQPAEYLVQQGDTLGTIAKKEYGSYAKWPALWWTNRIKIKNPDALTAGIDLRLSSWHPTREWILEAAVRAVPKVKVHSHSSSSGSSGSGGGAPAPSGSGCGLSGTLSNSQLESLWECAGGSASVAATAACIAIAESVGNQFATGPFGERGYWQINPVNGPVLSTYDPLGNARAAVSMSSDGSNWSAWTTAGSCGA
jgi:hypothetical protein